MKTLSETVIKNDMCIGCGACVYIKPEKYEIIEDKYGYFRALDKNSSEDEGMAPAVCPFSDSSLNEDEISERYFSKELPHDKYIGKYIDCYAGRVGNNETYQSSSSGGIGRWILASLLKAGKIDAVAAVFDSPIEQKGQNLFEYKVSRSPEEILTVSRSAYYPVQLSGVLEEIKRTPGRYAITGVPCFIKAIRNLCESDPILKERIVFTVGIICGHLKSRFYAEMLGWQLGVPPNDLRSIDFRKKIPGKTAKEKGVAATRISDPLTEVPAKTVKEMFGTDYGLGCFKYNACDFCDDVVAETADISIGDAWLPQFLESGTSLVIVRNHELNNFIKTAIQNKEVHLSHLTAQDAYTSQAAGFRHRREGLSFRLSRRERQGLWSPRKRVEAKPTGISKAYKRIFILRHEIIKISSENFLRAKEQNDLNRFKVRLLKFEQDYKIAYSKGIRRLIKILLKITNIPEDRVRRLIKRR